MIVNGHDASEPHEAADDHLDSERTKVVILVDRGTVAVAEMIAGRFDLKRTVSGWPGRGTGGSTPRTVRPGAPAWSRGGRSRTPMAVATILRGLNQLLPPSGPILNALARIDPLPSVTGPTAAVPPPARGILGAGGVRAAFGRVVKVTGTACGLGVEGSGWVAARDVIVTNAHVVAGESDTTVQAQGGPSLHATVVDFDSHDDVAVLRVPGLGVRPLTLAPNPATGTAVAILGYPLDGPFDAQPGRIGQTEVASTADAYGNGPVQRNIEALRGLVRPGNSGGPLVDAAGHVDGTVFAALTGTPTSSGGDGLAVPNAVVQVQLGRGLRSGPVGSGPCAG